MSPPQSSLPLKLTMQDRGVTAALGRRGHLWDTWYAAIQKPFFPFLKSQIQTRTDKIKTAASCVGERSQYRGNGRKFGSNHDPINKKIDF